MGVGRLSSGFLVNQSINFLNNNQSILSELQTKLSSGKNITNPSDDPVGLTRILKLSNTLKADDRFSRNIDSALSEVGLVDSTIAGVTDLIQRARELAVQGATFTQNQDGMNAIALEIDEIINQVTQLGNTNLGGKFIFGGKQTQAPPFDRPVGSDDINYSGNPPASAWGRPVEISDKVFLEINLNGESLLGQAQVTTVVPPVFSAQSGGVLQTLTELKLNLQQGDKDEVRARLDEVDVDLNNVLAQQAKIGALTNRLELTQSRIQERESIFTQQFAQIQDIDVPKVISELNFQNTVFQNSLLSSSRVMQTSLADFIR